MKSHRLLFALCGLLLFGLHLLPAQNPYERLGVRSDPLTLSQGRYQEFFPNDTLVQIGPVIFNTITQEVVGFVEQDSSGLDFPADVASRWLSPDPLAAKYPEMSPYVGIGNNPVIFIDPDGREIYLVINGETHRVERKTIKDSDHILIKSLQLAIRTPENPVSKYINDRRHDIYFVVNQTHNDHHQALPNAYLFNKGRDSKFEFDENKFRQFYKDKLPEKEFSDEDLQYFYALNGTDISKSKGKYFSMVILSDQEFGDIPSGEGEFLGTVTSKNAMHSGAMTVIHEVGAHIDERNTQRNPGGLHNVPDQLTSDWEKTGSDEYFTDMLKKHLQWYLKQKDK